MIIDWCLNLCRSLIDWVITTRPAWEMHMPSGVESVVSFVLAYNDVLPINETLICVSGTVSVVMAVQLWKWTVKLVDWIMDVIP